MGWGMRIVSIVVAAGLAMAAGTAHAQGASAMNVDIIIGVDDAGMAAAGDAIRTAQQGLGAERMPSAPDAALHLNPRTPLPAGLTLVAGSQTVPLIPGADGTIALPAGLDASAAWTVRGTAPTTPIVLRPVAMSPGTTTIDRRVGDLRAQCRLVFALAGPKFTAEQRAGFAAIGGCGGAIFTFNVRFDRPVAAARIGDRDLTLVRDGEAVTIPINDAAIADDARVTVTYR